MCCGVASDARGAAAGLRPALLHAARFAAAPLQREYTRVSTRHAFSLASDDSTEVSTTAARDIVNGAKQHVSAFESLSASRQRCRLEAALSWAAVQ